MSREVQRIMAAIEQELGQRKIIRSMGGPYEHVIAADYEARLRKAAELVIAMVEAGSHRTQEDLVVERRLAGSAVKTQSWLA